MMLKSKKIISFLMLLFLFFALTPKLSAQDEREKKAQEELKQDKEKTRKEIEKEGKKRHLKIQSKKTRKQMRRSKREAERRKKGKNPIPWYRRMFKGGRKTKRKRKS